MSRPGPHTRSRAIATIQHGQPSNLHDVEIIPEQLNTQHSRRLLTAKYGRKSYSKQTKASLARAADEQYVFNHAYSPTTASSKPLT
ncbi:hypothetical protein A2U01_0048017, partial [Trifolium medium]|nr:hypothetical protein [Trifolium medium]